MPHEQEPTPKYQSFACFAWIFDGWSQFFFSESPSCGRADSFLDMGWMITADCDPNSKAGVQVQGGSTWWIVDNAAGRREGEIEGGRLRIMMKISSPKWELVLGAWLQRADYWQGRYARPLSQTGYNVHAKAKNKTPSSLGPYSLFPIIIDDANKSRIPCTQSTIYVSASTKHYCVTISLIQYYSMNSVASKLCVILLLE